MVEFKTNFSCQVLRASGALLFLPAVLFLFVPWFSIHAEHSKPSVESSKPEKVEAELTQKQLDQIQVVMERLSQAFLSGNTDAAMGLFSPRMSPRKQERTREVLESEFNHVRYTVFNILDVQRDSSLSNLRHEIDVLLQCEYTELSSANGKGSSSKGVTQSYIFVVETLPEGAFLFRSKSDYFTQIGQQQSLKPVAWALSAVVALLAALVFWVWMGFEALRIRPRRPVWRVAVLVVPVIGALLFTFIVFLPHRANADNDTDEV